MGTAVGSPDGQPMGRKQGLGLASMPGSKCGTHRIRTAGTAQAYENSVIRQPFGINGYERNRSPKAGPERQGNAAETGSGDGRNLGRGQQTVADTGLGHNQTRLAGVIFDLATQA